MQGVLRLKIWKVLFEFFDFFKILFKKKKFFDTPFANSNEDALQ